MNTVKLGLSNARIEATNNKIKLIIRIAYGFRNIDTLISFVNVSSPAARVGDCPWRQYAPCPISSNHPRTLVAWRWA